MEFDRFKHNVTFHSLCYLIEHKKELNSNSMQYIEWAEDFFKSASKCLDSILNPKDEGGYYMMEPSIRDIMAAYGKNTSNISGLDVVEMNNNFKNVVARLEKLKNDSSSFYKTKEAHETFQFLSKLLPRPGIFSEYPTSKDLDGDD